MCLHSCKDDGIMFSREAGENWPRGGGGHQEGSPGRVFLLTCTRESPALSLPPLHLSPLVTPLSSLLLQDGVVPQSENLQVYLRVRPFTSAESNNGESQVNCPCLSRCTQLFWVEKAALIDIFFMCVHPGLRDHRGTGNRYPEGTQDLSTKP